MRKTDVVALALADLHFTHTPPLARSYEKDWYGVMDGYIGQLNALQAKHNYPPVLCAGDVFDKPTAPPQLVNFLLHRLPQMYAVPGQHDLPFHVYKDLDKSSFQTLVHADRIKLLEPGKPWEVGGMRLHGFPFGFEVTPLKKPHSLCLEIAVVHSYIWTAGSSYPGAPKSARLGAWRKKLKGYDVAVFGDNHKGFLTPGDHPGDLSILNCGSFMRRKADEVGYKPAVGLIHADGSVTPHYLDTKQDVIKQVEEDSIEGWDGTERALAFVQEVQEIHKEARTRSFPDLVKQCLRQVQPGPEVERLVLEAIAGEEHGN